MPFTLSHPVVVLPLVRVMPASALVIGTMSPDIPFYLPGRLWLGTHHWWALGTLNAALAAAAWVIWWALLVSPVVDILPRAAVARLPVRFAPLRCLRSWRGLLGLYGAFTLGAATHVGWDEFTHRRGWGPHHLPFLNTVIGPEPVWHWAQYISSVAGLAVVGLYLALWWRRTPPRPLAIGGRHRWAVPALAVVGAVGGLVAILRGDGPGSLAFVGLTRAGMAAGIAAVVLALAWHIARWQRRAAAGVPR